MTTLEIHAEALALLNSTFNIKYAINCREFDLDPEVLVAALTPFRNQPFAPKDKLLLVHMDTDYYDPLLPCGTIPINSVRIFKNLDIPLHAMLFVTMHFGIKQEFDLLLRGHHPKDRPLVIETLLNPSCLNYHAQSTVDLAIDKIEKQGICMMNKQRSHRVALWNFLQDNHLIDKIAVSQHFNA